jgi:hypothetical protein
MTKYVCTACIVAQYKGTNDPFFARKCFWQRCYGFQKYFPKDIRRKIWRFLHKILLVLAKV